MRDITEFVVVVHANVGPPPPRAARVELRAQPPSSIQSCAPPVGTGLGPQPPSGMESCVPPAGMGLRAMRSPLLLSNMLTRAAAATRFA